MIIKKETSWLTDYQSYPAPLTQQPPSNSKKKATPWATRFDMSL
jgi:hypothetical protein